MDDREQQRRIRHRLAVLRHAEEVSGNVAATCRYYGISRQCFYKWKRRYDELGEEGLRDGSSRPHHSPNAADPEVIAKVIYLRRSYHFGPGRILMYLARYHDVSISPSGVWRILKRLELNRLPASQRHERQDEFQGSFHWHLLDRGIQHVYIRPRTPRLNGKVERSHRIDNDEFYKLLDGVVIDDTGLFNEKLQEWEDFYNFHRPHGGLGGQTPYERLLQRTKQLTPTA